MTAAAPLAFQQHEAALMATVVSASVVFTGEMLILLGLVQSAEQFFIERGQSSLD